jgi:uncharacterized protein
MPGLYLDSSALTKLYLAELETPHVAQWVREQAEAIPFSFLHELELSSALERRQFAAELTPTGAKRIVRAIEVDLQNGVLRRPTLDWSNVFSTAIRLVRRHGQRGLRSLDSLHIASALQIRPRMLITFDQKQASAAAREGLKVLP